MQLWKYRNIHVEKYKCEKCKNLILLICPFCFNIQVTIVYDYEENLQFYWLL